MKDTIVVLSLGFVLARSRSEMRSGGWVWDLGVELPTWRDLDVPEFNPPVPL